jgi:hypothetical protein
LTCLTHPTGQASSQNLTLTFPVGLPTFTDCNSNKGKYGYDSGGNIFDKGIKLAVSPMQDAKWTSKVDKFYLDMECLDIGKTLEDGRHCLDFTAVLEMQQQSQDLDTRDDGAWAHLSAHLQCECAKYNALNQKL